MSLNAKRAWASIIDYGIIGVIATFTLEGLQRVSVSFLDPTYVTLSVIAVLSLGKDIVFKNASVGKKLFGLYVISTEDGGVPKIGRLILRNLPLGWIFPVEFIMVYFAKHRRLGDMWVKTEVVVIPKKIKTLTMMKE